MIGATISQFHILEKLGEGGMGVVYKAEDTKPKRTGALKSPPPELTRDEEDDFVEVVRLPTVSRGQVGFSPD
jgi:serine/threonine protein kinase